MQSDIVQRLQEKWCGHSGMDESHLVNPDGPEAAAVIRDYGDKRYQQAIADVVEWLHSENGLCDCFARSATECACGGWDDYKKWPLERTAQEITRRFGKDA